MNSRLPDLDLQPTVNEASATANRTHMRILVMAPSYTGLPGGQDHRTIPARHFMAKKKKYLQGQIILDHGNLQGSFFHRTVILICQHDEQGAFGLVLNRDTGHRVGEAVVANLPEILKDLPLYNGGPVQQQALSFLHSDSFLPDANVMPNLNLHHSLDTLAELGESYSPTQKVKVFAGYAGWSPGQLEDEMKRDTWMVHPASLDLVYHAKPDAIWSSILKKKGGIYRLVADAPDDLSWN